MGPAARTRQDEADRLKAEAEDRRTSSGLSTRKIDFKPGKSSTKKTITGFIISLPELPPSLTLLCDLFLRRR